MKKIIINRNKLLKAFDDNGNYYRPSSAGRAALAEKARQQVVVNAAERVKATQQRLLRLEEKRKKLESKRDYLKKFPSKSSRSPGRPSGSKDKQPRQPYA
jgi:hypothetical protein